jgi:hypothetical protein
MAREMYGITALDPKVAATEKFIQDQKIPPDKVEDFLLSMGADPKLASLVFKYRRVQEAAKKQQSQPPTASVDQEVSNQYAQLKQQERMGQGVAGMAAPNLAAAPMQGGITGQPMKQMAGGGIVAFDRGGDVPHWDTIADDAKKVSRASGFRSAVSRGFSGLAALNPIKHPLLTAGLLGGAYLLSPDEEEPQKVEGATVEVAPESTEFTDEEIRLLARDQASQKEGRPIATPSGSGMRMPKRPEFLEPTEALQTFKDRVERAKARLPKSEEDAIAAEMERERDYLGQLESREKRIAQQEKEGTTSSEKKFWLAFAQAGFAASAKGARDLWETLSIGGVEGMKAYESMKEKEQQLRERLQEKRFQLEDLRSQVKRGATKAGRERFDALTNEVNSAETALANAMIVNTAAKNTYGAQMYEAEARAAINASNQAAADRRLDRQLEAKTQSQKLDDQIANAVAKANNFNLSPEERAANQKLVDKLVRQRAEINATSPQNLGIEARLASQAAMMGDGFDTNVQPLE